MNLHRIYVVASLLAVSGILAGCPVNTDLGTKCTLVRRNPDGGTPITLKESEIKAGRDVISFGATGCEDLTCVRDLAYPAAPDRPNDDATGYCSRACAEGTTCPSGDPNRVLNCRELILDAVTLQALCQDEPKKCQQTIGNVTKPFFCASGVVTDAGM